MRVPKRLAIATATAVLLATTAIVWPGASPAGNSPGNEEGPAPEDLAEPGARELLTHAAPPAGARPVLDMRELLLSSTAEDLGLSPVLGTWGVLYEVGVANGAATAVCLADGTTSLYLTSGSSVIGAGEDVGVADAAFELCAAASEHLEQTRAVRDNPLPGDGRVRFVLLTTNGPRSAEVSGHELEDGEHPLAPLHEKGQAVLTAVRLSTQAR